MLQNNKILHPLNDKIFLKVIIKALLIGSITLAINSSIRILFKKKLKLKTEKYNIKIEKSVII